MTVLLSPLALSIPSLVTSFQIFTQSPRGSAESYFIVNRLFGFSNDPKFLSPKRNCPPNSFIFLFYFILFFYLLNFLTHPISRHQLQLRVGLQVQCSRCIKCSSSLRSSTVFRSPHFESITSTMAAHAENVTFRQCAHLATPDHVTADFCLIPVRPRPSPQRNTAISWSSRAPNLAGVHRPLPLKVLRSFPTLTSTHSNVYPMYSRRNYPVFAARDDHLTLQSMLIKYNFTLLLSYGITNILLTFFLFLCFFLLFFRSIDRNSNRLCIAAYRQHPKNDRGKWNQVFYALGRHHTGRIMGRSHQGYGTGTYLTA
ncbi:hypothetical protein TWF751_010676 [Orbilia oligospora]|nr:hypothetical protein TWF751_010676 [Orbilia oligospora]